MHTEFIFGVPHIWFFLITIFWIAVAVVIFGAESLDDGTVGILICFFTFGTTVLIGRFGWQILILPSLVIISTAGFLVWRAFFR